MRRRTFLVLFASIMSSNMLPATDYYVAPGGDNGGPGAIGTPWQTIQKAADTLQAGDTVYIRAGTYAERVQPQGSGSAGAVISYLAYPGETVIIDGASITLPTWWGGLFDISNRSYIRVSGIEVRNAGPNDNNPGILVDDSSHIVIDHCRTYNTTSSGIGVWGGSDVLIVSNEVELACNDGEQECITVGGTDTFEVAYNHVFNGGPGSIGGEGIDAKDGCSNGTVHHNLVHDLSRLGLYVDAWDKVTGNVEVYSNVVYGCSTGIAVATENGGLLSNVRVYNNIIYENAWVGIAVAGWGEPGESHSIEDVAILNNTIIDNGYPVWGGCMVVEDNPDLSGVLIRNNLCSQNNSHQIVIDGTVSGLVVDHNLIDGFRGEVGEIYGDDYQTGDPAFVDRAARDLHLQTGSPAIGNATATDAPTVDFDGNPRPQGGGWDIGCYEHPPAIFIDGFEPGDTTRWPVTVGS